MVAFEGGWRVKVVGAGIGRPRALHVRTALEKKFRVFQNLSNYREIVFVNCAVAILIDTSSVLKICGSADRLS